MSLSANNVVVFFFSSIRRHTRFSRDWSSDVCSSDLDDQSGKYEAVDVPEHLRETEKTLHDRLVEMVAETNEELMEEFFEKGTLPQEDLLKGLRRAVLSG